jgi:prepilin-type N-terminal cleavage/methylation domain-containing protein
MSLRFSEVRKGFTLVEMLSVTVIIAFLASIIVGRLQNDRAGLTFQRGFQGIESAANMAKNQALRTGQTSVLTFDSSTQSLKVSAGDQTPSTGNGPTLNAMPTISKTSPTTTNSANSASTQVAPDTKLGTGWTVSQVQKADGTTEAEMSIKFYADGSAETKTVEFLNDKAPVTLSVKQNGTIDVKRGALTTTTPSEWEAGNLELRAGT